MDIRVPVLIVDDEYLIRSLVRNSIDWDGLGFTIVGEAEDGQVALDLVEKLRPRLAVVDINIPFLNGLDLAQTIRLRYPDIKVIILTGYEDFQFAQKAIRAGVLNYILKPINPKEFSETLVAAREVILEEERNRYGFHESPELGSEEGSAVIKRRFLRSLLSRRVFPEAGYVVDRFRMFKINLDPRDLVVCVTTANRACFEPSLMRDAAYESFQDEKGRCVLLFNDDPVTVRVKDKRYYEICADLLREAENRGATIGVGGVASGPEEIPSSYEQALAALEERFFTGTKRIIVFSEMKRTDRPNAEMPPPSPDRENLLRLLRGGNVKEIETGVRSLFYEMETTRPARLFCEMIGLELAGIVAEFLEENHIRLESIFNGDRDAGGQLRDLETLKAMEEWALALVENALRQVDTGRGTRTQLVVHKAKSFIERNYGKKYVSLEQIAEYASVTPSYLSTVFKKELGSSIIEYLTECRLKKAKEIMDADPLVPIAELADSVGYSDPYYFSKCFRKQFGLSPSFYLRGKKRT